MTATATTLATIAAAVVGVFLNLAIWFGLHVIFAEVAERQLLKVLGGCALLGILLSLAL